MVRCTEAEGPYRRFAVWVRGCSLRCAGCCNPELFERAGVGRPVTELLDAIAEARDEHAIEGITILGGEPLEQLDGTRALAQGARALDLGVVVFSGYTLLEARRRTGFNALWASLDTLVDGRFEAGRLDHTRRFVGSANQRLVHRTERYRDPALWRGQAAAELRIDADGRLSVHGDPATVRRLIRVL